MSEANCNNRLVLPCPFCGGESVLVESLTIKVVGCRNCGARIGSSIDRKQTADQLVAAWNLRKNKLLCHCDIIL